SPSTDAGTGELAVVNRSGSPFGAGWWLSGLEELHELAGDTLLVVGGDGAVRKYAPAGSGVWGASGVTRPDTVRTEGSGWVREIPGGGEVVFNSLGWHVETRNRLGHGTEFTYTGTPVRMTQIELPV